ncbi:MAG: acetylxylan esterase [Blastocatellia bacterium]
MRSFTALPLWIGAFLFLSVFVSYAQAQPLSPAATRAAFLKLIERPLVPLAPETQPREMPTGMQQWHFTYATEAGQRVPGLLVKAASGPTRRPVVIVLHGTGGTKEGVLDWLQELAAQGFIGVAIDGRYHGERTKAGKGSTEYSAALLRTYRTRQEHPFLYDTVWDVMRLLDYLATRPDVEPQRIALLGISKGGMETYLTAAVDPRVAVAVPFIGVQSFRWALENNAWQSRVGTFQDAVNAAAQDEGVTEINAAFVRRFYERVMPGIADRFDGPQMVPLIAPRPLLVINGEIDPRTPMPGLAQCIEKTRTAYKQAQAEDKFVFQVQPKTGHTVTKEARQQAWVFLQKWLSPQL